MSGPRRSISASKLAYSRPAPRRAPLLRALRFAALCKLAIEPFFVACGRNRRQCLACRFGFLCLSYAIRQPSCLLAQSPLASPSKSQRRKGSCPQEKRHCSQRQNLLSPSEQFACGLPGRTLLLRQSAAFPLPSRRPVNFARPKLPWPFALTEGAPRPLPSGAKRPTDGQTEAEDCPCLDSGNKALLWLSR